MGLLEESGILVKDEKVLMRGACSGLIPIGELAADMGKEKKLVWLDLHPTIGWKRIEGEIVLTNQRVVVLTRGEQDILFYELDIVDARIWKPVFGKAKLQLVLKFDFQKEPVKAKLAVDNPEEWVNAIKSNPPSPEFTRTTETPEEQLLDDSRVRDLRGCLRKSLGDAEDWFSNLFWQAIKKFLQERGADESERNKFKAAAVEELKSKGLEGVLGVTTGQLLSTYRSRDAKSLNEMVAIALEKIWFEQKRAQTS